MYEIIKYDNYVHIKPISNIDNITASTFKNIVLSTIYETNYKTVIIDFSYITKIDSIGCGIILDLYKKLKLKNKIIELINVSQSILNLLYTMRLNKSIKINSY